MKTKIMKHMQLAPIILLALAMSACGKIPSAYRGTYVDASSGTKIELGGNDGTMTEKSGRILKSSADALQFDSLNSAEPGIYIRNSSSDANLMEVFWLVPQLTSRKEEQGFVWMNAEVIYTRMRADAKDPVQEIQLLHCEDGLLMLDVATQTWNGGCPNSGIALDAKRQETK